MQGQDYEIFEQGGQVCVKLGEDVRMWDSRRARLKSAFLASGADIAADQGRSVRPDRYDLPGSRTIVAELAYWLVWQIVATACEIDMLNSACCRLTDEPVTIMLDNGATCRIAD